MHRLANVRHLADLLLHILILIFAILRNGLQNTFARSVAGWEIDRQSAKNLDGDTGHVPLRDGADLQRGQFAI